jgi:signal transduction histidine kinase
VPEIKKITLYRVLQELMTNMKKHSNATLVALTFNHAKKKITVEYSDNGVGCTIKKHVGLQNAENRIKTIKGTIIFDSQTNQGFKTKIIV